MRNKCGSNMNTLILKPCAVFILFVVILQISTITSRHSPTDLLFDPTLGVHKFIKVNNVTLHYVENGDSSKPLMLLVHGFPEFWYSWRYQLREFCDNYWMVAIDLPGFGDSDKPLMQSFYHVDNVVRIIRELVQILGRDKFTLIGHDTGGWIGWRYLDFHMDTIDKYILMGSPSLPIFRYNMETSPLQLILASGPLFLTTPIAPELAMKSFDLAFLKIIQGDNKIKRNTITDEDIDAYKYTYGKPGAISGSLRIYRENIPPPDLKEPIRDKSQDRPGLVLFGDEDIFTIRKSVAQLKQAYFNLEHQEVKDTSHFLQQDNPVAVNRIMREFLSRKT